MTALATQYLQLARAQAADAARTSWPSAAWRGRIVEFCRDVLGKRTLAPHQIDVLERWQQAGRVEIPMCTGQKLGKTDVLEDAAGYDFATTPKLNGLVFGPKLEHTNEVFWPRFALMIINSFLPCTACMPAHRAWCALVEADPLDETPRPERCASCSPLIPSEPRDPKDPGKGRKSDWLDPRNSETGLRAPDGRAIRGYAGRKEGSKGGFSGEVRFYCDESSDISDIDRETIRGNMSGGGKALFAGNMLYTWGWFYRAFTTERAAYTYVLQMSSRRSPNCRGVTRWSDGVVTPENDNATCRPIKGMATPEDVEANLRAWKGTNLIAARIDATPPKVVEGQLANAERVKEAEERWRPGEASGQLQIGVDVARARDRLAVCVRRGITMLELWAEALGEDDHAKGVELVLGFVKEHRKPKDPLPRLVYDASGLEGQAFTCELKAQRAEEQVELVPVYAAHRPRDWKHYDKRRDEVKHKFLAEKLPRIAIIPDVELEGEIAATVGETVEVSYGSGGQRWPVLRVISNDAMRARIGRSPDKLDAASLAFLDVDGQPHSEEAAIENARPPRRSPAARAATPSSREDEGAFDPWGAADEGMRAAWGAA